jgi:hypothetical protein
MRHLVLFIVKNIGFFFFLAIKRERERKWENRKKIVREKGREKRERDISCFTLGWCGQLYVRVRYSNLGAIY